MKHTSLRFIASTSFLAAAAFALCGCMHGGGGITDAAALRDGDIVFQDSHSPQSEDVKAVTSSRFSHCGIYFDGGVYESAGGGLKPWSTWVARDHGRFTARRAGTQLSAGQLAELRRAASRLSQKPYDWLFRWDDEKIYCSELVWKAYHEIGVDLGGRETLSVYYKDKAKKLLDERYKKAHAGAPQPAGTIITPQRLFESLH